LAQRGADLFAAATRAGVQIRFEASVCAAIPVIRVLRESLVVTNVHRVLGIVNGTTNFMLTQMESGADYAGALAEAQRLGYAEADPTEDVEGAFNAVMLQGDAIREITLEGPGAGGIETASAVVGDMVSVIGTQGTGFLQNDATWRELEKLPPGELRSPFYIFVEVDDKPG